MGFIINDTLWQIKHTKADSRVLMRSDSIYSLGVTDRNTHTIYLSSALHGYMQRKVLIHEVCHAICMSYSLYLPIETEEIICDFVASYGDEVMRIADRLLKNFAIDFNIPRYIDIDI